MSWGNAATDVAGGRGPGEWLRWRRQARAWSRPEMARQLIKAAKARDDASMPGIDNICRWEHGTVGLTERYKLYYCVEFGISADEFGVGQSERTRYLPAFSPGELAVLDLVTGIVGLWRDFRREMTISRNAGGGDGIAGIEVAAHDRSS
jgi:hypothetical protein